MRKRRKPYRERGFAVLVIVTMLVTTLVGGLCLFSIVNHRTATGGAMDRLMENTATPEDMDNLQKSTQDFEKSAKILRAGASFIGSGGPVPSPGSVGGMSKMKAAELTESMYHNVARMQAGVLHRAMMNTISQAAKYQATEDQDGRTEWWQDDELIEEPTEWWEDVAEPKPPTEPSSAPAPGKQPALQPEKPPPSPGPDLTNTEWRITVHYPPAKIPEEIDWSGDVSYRVRVIKGKPGEKMEFYVMRIPPYRHHRGTIKNQFYSGSYDGRKLESGRMAVEIAPDGRNLRGRLPPPNHQVGYPFDGVRIR